MDYHSVVGDALGILIAGLIPFVERVVTVALPPGVAWTELLSRQEAAGGRAVGQYRSDDLSLMLQAMTERLGDFGYPFRRHLSRQGQNYASELREVHHRWARTEMFTAPESYRAIDSVELLLRAIGDDADAEKAGQLKSSVNPMQGKHRADVQAPVPADQPSPAPTPGRHAAAPTIPQGPQADAAIPAARIQISAIADLSYPMASCRVPVVDHVTVDTVGGDLRGVVLQIDVVSAGGSLGGPKEVHLDLAPGTPTVLPNVDLVLDPACMLGVDEPQPGLIRATLRDASGGVVAEASKDVNILAANQWKATPLQLALEMLAAHVQPNSAAITALMPDVSDRLNTSTGQSAIDGYQADSPERVDAIAEAIWESMRSRDIRYAEPPASWGADGQKVRTPREVLDGRLGTCLDTTVTLAAALEQAGINSTLWVLKGHAFLGYWRVDSALDVISSTEVADVINLVGLDQIRLVETTMVTGGGQSAPFADAVTAPRVKFLEGDLSQILGVTDVRQARQSQIYPLPSRDINAGGDVVVTQYVPGPGRVIAPYQPVPGASPRADKESVPTRVSQWKNALLDLSLRNRLINFTDRAGYRLEVPAPALGRFEDAVNATARITLLASDAVQEIDIARGVRYGRDLPEQEREVLLAEKRSAYIDITEAAYKSKLRYLANKAKTIVEETGSNNLYLAFGMLIWRFEDRELRSPLVLVPVTMSTANRGEHYVLTIDEAGTSTPNYCLVEKLRVAVGLEIPGFTNPTGDASGIDLAATFDAIRRAIAGSGLHFRVEETVHLSVLQFAKFPLWKDLDESWKALSGNSLVTHLIHSPLEPFADTVPEEPDVDLDELSAAVPVSADSSQLGAVAAAVAGHTFVLEGPPGTGKSQTITNILAQAISSGRRVLFVAEKRAALDVVKKRLHAVGLGDVSLDLFDKSARPASVREQIRSALDLRVSADQDSLRTQAETSTSSRKTLARYAQRLHEVNAAGLSLYSARSSELAADQEVPPLEVPRSLVASGTAETLDGIHRVLRALPETADLARPSMDHPWGFITALPTGGLDAGKIHSAAVEFDTALDDAHTQGLELGTLGRCANPVTVTEWAKLAVAPRYPLHAIDTLHAAEWAAEMTTLEGLITTVSHNRPRWLDIASPAAMDRDITAVHEHAVTADQSGFFGRKKRRRAVLAQFMDVLVVDPKTIDLKSLSAMTAEIAATFAAVTDLRRRVAKLPVRIIDDTWNPLIGEQATRVEHALQWLRWLTSTLSSHPDSPHIADLRQFYAGTPAGTFAASLGRLATAWTNLESASGVRAEQQQRWAGGGDFIGRWWATRGPRRLETSATTDRWVDLVRHIEPLRAAGMDSARTAILTGRIVPEDAGLAFDRGAAIASIAERREATALGDFDVAAHNKTIRRFTTSARAIRDELPRAIPAGLLARRRFDANAASGQVGGLRRQLERRRGGMGVRTLIETYGELISQILPCTLMSPESVARFLPARNELFDVVVFDEASQIRVADAIGAMGRCRSVVVVGDSKQMPPTSFAEATASIDDDDYYSPDVVADEESILTECVNAQVPKRWLSWHYRSQDESLIAFSNHHYYEGRLASFPAPFGSDGAPVVAGHGISLVRINGTFDRSGRGKSLRTNRVEADAIVDDIKRRFRDTPDVAPSLGVITFNAPQRDLIENLLRDSADERMVRALDEPDGLFVKNLENVQGDERDTILFSVAFSANDRGVVPLNFGPLSRAGGERRLNVAVTRARRQVVLYASFDPEALRAEETTQLGTKHLKEYLQMAARGVDAATDSGSRMPIIDRHRDDIADALRKAGFAVKTDVGLSDFRVDIVLADADAPQKPLAAVLLDGPAWRARRTVADRDGLPVDVLQNLMHWPAVERVWLPEWLEHRGETIARLRAAANEAKQRVLLGEVGSEPAGFDTSPATAQVKPEPITIRSNSIEAAPAPSRTPQHTMVQTFREWVPGRLGDIRFLDELPFPTQFSRVRAAISAAIAAEGPIQPDRLARLVANAFGLNRVNEDRRRSIQHVVPVEYRRATGEGFYWPKDTDPQTWRIVRRPPDGVARPLEEVCLIEIGNAMMVVAEQTGGIQTDDLKREALTLFGGRRITQEIGARLDAALTEALTKGLLNQSNTGIISSAH